MADFIKRLNPFLILLFVILLGYWQVSFLANSFKWDLIDVVFPFRYHFSECIQSGYFPFWNPYQQTGTPFYADLQVPFYYPELLFTSLFTGYSIYTMHFLFIGYVFISGVGMSKLSFHFNNDRIASLFAGIAYSFSGFIVGHGQHFFLLVGAAWIPFALLYYIKLLQNKRLIDALKTSVFLFLLISGGYQALSIIMAYLFVLLFIYFSYQEISQRRYKDFFNSVKLNFYTVILLTALCLPLIVSTIEVLPVVDRLKSGVSLSTALGFGQSLNSILSLILPFTTLKNDAVFGADASMTNHYIGLVLLILLIPALLKKRTPLEYLILVFGVIIFASSFSFLPLRALMFKHIPFMDMFKNAAYIRVFGLLALILVSSDYLAYFRVNIDKEKTKVIASAAFVATTVLFFLVYSAIRISNSDLEAIFHQNSLPGFLETMTFYQQMLIQAAVQFIVCFVLLLIVINIRKFKQPFYFILAVSVVDIFVASQLNMYHTVVDAKVTPYQMSKDLSLYPNHFPIPIDSKIIFNDQRVASFPPFWRNTYIFSKQISFDAFSSFELKSYGQLNDKFPNLRKAVLNNHLFYFSDTILPISQFVESRIDYLKNHKLLYFSDNEYNALSGLIAKSDSTDNATISEFSPNRITVETSTKNDQFLTSLQTNFKGWKAFIDDKQTPIYTSNFNYRTVFLPKGNHKVVYEFKNQTILILYIFSNILFVLCSLILIWIWLNNKKYRGKALYILVPVILTVTAFFLYKRITYKDASLNTQQVFRERWKNKNSLFHYQNGFESLQAHSGKEDSLIVFAGNYSFHADSTTEIFKIAEINNSKEKLKEGTLVVRAKIYPGTYIDALIVSDLDRGIEYRDYNACKIENQIERTNQWNNIIYFKNFNKLKEDDVIKVFIWNLKKASFQIDDITVDFYR